VCFGARGGFRARCDAKGERRASFPASPLLKKRAELLVTYYVTNAPCCLVKSVTYYVALASFRLWALVTYYVTNPPRGVVKSVTEYVILASFRLWALVTDYVTNPLEMAGFSSRR